MECKAGQVWMCESKSKGHRTLRLVMREAGGEWECECECGSRDWYTDAELRERFTLTPDFSNAKVEIKADASLPLGTWRIEARAGGGWQSVQAQPQRDAFGSNAQAQQFNAAAFAQQRAALLVDTERKELLELLQMPSIEQAEYEYRMRLYAQMMVKSPQARAYIPGLGDDRATAKPAPRAHDFSDPYCVLVLNQGGVKQIYRRCVACGTEREPSLRYSVGSCIPVPGWREKARPEAERLDRQMTGGAGIAADLKPARTFAPPAPSPVGFGSLVGVYRKELPRHRRAR